MVRSLESCLKLEQLRLQGNKLTLVPPEICNLFELRLLDVPSSSFVLCVVCVW